MPNYQNGKIYTVVEKSQPDVILYVGSTTQTRKKRWSSHQHRTPDRELLLYQTFPCDTKDQLRAREDEVCLLLKPKLNKRKCTLGYDLSGLEGLDRKSYCKQYRQQNREQERARKRKLVTCDCGDECRYDTIARHKTRKIHKDNMRLLAIAKQLTELALRNAFDRICV